MKRLGVLGVLVLAVALTTPLVFATGTLGTTNVTAIQAGQPVTADCAGTCPSNQPGEPVSISITVTNQNGQTVASGAGATTGNGPVSVAVTVPAVLVNSGDTLKFSVEIEQTTGDGKDQSHQNKVP